MKEVIKFLHFLSAFSPASFDQDRNPPVFSPMFLLYLYMQAHLRDFFLRDRFAAFERKSLLPEAFQLSDEKFFPVHRLVERNVHFLAPLALKIPRLFQHAVQPRRGNFQYIRLRHDVSRVQLFLQLLAERLAVLDADSFRLVDEHAEIPVLFLHILDVDKLDAAPVQKRFRHLPDCFFYNTRHKCTPSCRTHIRVKSGLTPTLLVNIFLYLKAL